ncbi:MAG: hypothetical protein CVT74_12135, partial [Alphaproteobacteria bacterium HGW-Alphaproteobacteria-13]
MTLQAPETVHFARDTWVGRDAVIGEVDGVYGLVVANIMTHILLAMRDALVARVAPGGLLMLTGLLTTP